jgi:hypothetical protein
MHSGRGDGPSRPPGYPIRKPPDHSLAAGSPGNIAGSSVLPRLLVPRHPPCALKNLAHYNTTYAEEPPTPPKGEKGAPGTRCSRPLCSSQETDSNPGHHPRQRDRQPRPAKRKPRHQTGTRFLRTQQRAHREPAPPPPFRTPPAGGTYWTGGRNPPPVNSQCSTRKHGRPGGHTPPAAPGAP